MKVIQILGLMVVIASSASVAQASLITYTVDNPGGSDSAGDITKVETSYDTSSGDFTWSYDITTPAPHTDKVNDAFWLVLSDGPNPKDPVGQPGAGRSDQLAILYGDFTRNTTRLSAYRYNGENNNQSYEDLSGHLQDFGDVIDVTKNGGTQTVSFSIKVDVLNGLDLGTSAEPWEGIQFGSQIGIWFHPSADSTFKYYGNTYRNRKKDRVGKIKEYTYHRQGWYDTSHQTTVIHDVPEPAGIALLAAGVVGLGCAKRRRRSVA